MAFFAKLKTAAVLSLTLLGLSCGANADWILNQETSSLYYVTSKAGTVSEKNSFTELSGRINAAGEATVNIYLESVDTAIDIRNQRVRDILFQVADYPLAEITLAVDSAQLNAMATGSMKQDSYAATITLHGQSQNLNLVLMVSKLSAERILVHNVEPLIVNAAAFGLAGGVEELRKIAGLAGINPNVTVNFSLVFEAG